MTGERFYVATTWGFRRHDASGDARHGVSAMVLDRANRHSVVRLYRSEDRGPGPGGYLGRDRARRKAEAEAVLLNAAVSA